VLLIASPAGLLAQPASFDHSAFDALLRRHVAGGMVDYDAFKSSPDFEAYLRRLAGADVAGLPSQERLALYINAYNAYTIRLVNKNGERDSIRNINKTLGLKLKGPWSEQFAVVAGRTHSLDGIEHGIIRKEWREPRIHFALVCAAMGCPPLRSEAYTGERLDAQLDDQARAFLVRSPEKNRVDLRAGTFHASMVLTWYRDDFGGSDAAVARYVAGFYPEGPERELLLSGKARLVKNDYDWTLNSQEKARGRR
jgi:hypothetical protein